MADQIASPEFDAMVEAVGRAIGRERRSIDADVAAQIVAALNPINRNLDSLKSTLVGVARQRAAKPPQPPVITTLMRALLCHVVGTVSKSDDYAGIAEALFPATAVAAAVRNPGAWWRERAVTNPAMTGVSAGLANWSTRPA